MFKLMIISLILASAQFKDTWSVPPTEAIRPSPTPVKVSVAPAKPKPAEVVPKPVSTAPSAENERLLYYAMKYTYVRESKGPNRSPEIDVWNKFSGAPLGSPYCASFVSYMHYLAGVTAPKTAWSPSSVGSKNIKFSEVKGGDVFGMYFSSKGRVAHTGFVKEVKGSLIYTVEANTSPSASSGSSSDRDGDGVFAKSRSKFLMENSKNKYSRFWSQK